MSAVPIELEADRAESLQRRLASALVQLRRRASDPVALERRIAVAGATMAAGGIVLVLLAWYGAAHTSRLYLQIPYLISGGLLGVVLAVAGGCTFLASWLTRLVQEERSRADEALAVARDTVAALGRIEALLVGGGAESIVAGSDRLVATPAGKLAHRPSCPTVAGRSDLRRVTLDDPGLAPCRMCDAAAP
jgi:hypothetical protein